MMHWEQKTPVVALSCVVICMAGNSFAQENAENSEPSTILTAGVVKEIIDGDSFKYCPTKDDSCTEEQLVEVDLWGVDAPELTPKEQFYSKKAVQYLIDELRDQTVVLEQIRVAENGKPQVKVMIVNHPHSNFNVHLLLEGHGWVATTTEDNQVDIMAYRQAEKFARERKLGLWREVEPVAPWDWLRQHRKDDEEEEVLGSDPVEPAQ